MSGRTKFSTVATVGAFLLLPAAALAFNPQPDPPGKVRVLQKSLGGPDTTAAKGDNRGPVFISEENDKVMHKRRNH